MLLIAVVIAGYVHHTMGQVRQLLPREILEQQRDISAIVHSLGKLVHALDLARVRGGARTQGEGLDELHETLALLGTMRQDYTFDSLTGASAVHALVNPAAQDIERWLVEGVPGYPPDSPVVLNLAHQRALETHDEVRALEARTQDLALTLLGAEVDRLNRVRYSLMALILAFAMLVAGVAVLYIRQRNAKEHLAVVHGRLTDSMEGVGQAVALFDGDERLVMCNQRYRELFDLPAVRPEAPPTLVQVVGAALRAGKVLGIDDHTEALEPAYRARRADPGRSFEMHWHDGRHFQVSEHTTHERGTICFLTNITDLKVAQRRLEHLATHDALTGLPSRRRFEKGLEEALHRAGRHAGQLAVVFVDVDRLKWVNDTYGHVAGDRFLKEFGLRLRGALRDHDLVARLGGDEFAVILADIEGWAQAAAFAERAMETLSRPMQIDGGIQIQATVSMGLALYPADGEDAAALMKKADDACYHAKSSGRANFQFYTEGINLQSARRASIEHRLRVALGDGALEAHYQPQRCLEEGRITGLEALLRWDDPVLGTVDPSEFVPVAEDSGLGRMLLSHTVSEVCRQLRRWLDEGVTPCRVWVNVSPRQLMDVISVVNAATSRFGVGAQMLGIEITERTLVDDPARAGRVLAEIREHGMSLAIDDFGVGYSSLGALKDYPLDELKIDASFVRDLGGDGHEVEIVRAIVALGRSLHLKVVAEGVETEEQARVLRAQGVHSVQGHYVSDAVSGDRATVFLTGETAPA